MTTMLASASWCTQEYQRQASSLDRVIEDVIAPPPGELYSETNDNSVAILLTYGTARILLAGDAEAREEEYMANGPYTGPLAVIKV
jgi:beta-lactamase superfamily II metal-dependent hydrolase